MTSTLKNRSFRIPLLTTYYDALRKSFLFRRRPRWRMNKEWEHPQDPENDAKYQETLHWEGFITPSHWQEDDILNFPLIKQDLADLEEYLLPIFWNFNQKASYYQNNYYKYQWVFMLGAFLTTILAVLTGYYGGLNSETARFLILEAKTDTWTNIFGILTTIISGVTTFYNYLSSHGEPRKRWASYRRLTEELRMTYFKFLSRTEPFDREDRV